MVADMMALVGHRVAQADMMPSFNAGNEYAGRARGGSQGRRQAVGGGQP